MINKKIDEISAKLEIIKLLVQDNEYLSNVEKRCDEVNKRNQILADRIDKAIEYFYKLEDKEEYVHTDYVYEMINILKGEDNE